MRASLLGALFALAFTSSAFALDMENDVVWFNFDGWDHGLVSTTGQDLTDVYQDVDLFAMVSGDVSTPTTVLGNRLGLTSANLTPGFQQFDFTLSRPLPLIVRYLSTDDQEVFSVEADKVLSHGHTLGGIPTVTHIANGMEVQGSARTMASLGASRGYFVLGEVDQLSITHTALVPNKYESFRVGVPINPVPEPTSMGLAACGLAALALRRRRK